MFFLRQVWDLFRGDGALLSLAAVAALLNFLGTAAVFTGLLAVHREGGADLLALPVVLALGFAATAISTYCNVALLHLAQERLEGRPCDVGTAFTAANRRLPAILGWSLLAVGVGALLRLVAERLPWGGVVVGWLLGFTWSLATMFALPVLVVEGASPWAAGRRSAKLFRARWGEGVIGLGTVEAIGGVAVVPGLLLIFLGISLGGATGLVEIGLGAAAVAIVVTFSRGLGQLYALAVYRDEVLDARSFGLGRRQLDELVRPKRRKRR